MTALVLQVSVLNTNRDSFDYYANENLPTPCIGARVWVSFRNKTRLGIIVGIGTSSNYPTLKPITSIIDDTSLFTDELLALCRWISRYYHAPLAQVMALALPKRYRLGKMPSTRQRKLMESLPDDCNPEELTLHQEQQHAVDTIKQHWGGYHSYLLQGVTGSGKTEVYLHITAHALNEHKQVLILVPEIGLTPQLLGRFKAKFKHIPIAIIHSHITDTERAHTWKSAKDNQTKIIIGTRSALFTPMPQLGLIIIDEEHDPSFKQMDGVRLSARDAALIRAQLQDIPIILGSATPSLESLYNCEINKYTKLRLTTKARNQFQTQYQLIDIRNQTLHHGLAEPTLKTIQTYLEKQLQILIFINRRGFSPVLLCHQCGWIADCTACDSHLTLHRHKQQLICHHCGVVHHVPKACQSCQSTELLPIGSGTQRVEEGLATQFPNINIARIDRDEIKNTQNLHHHLASILEGTPQIMIGTQMLAKGHHFPKLALVIVLDTDAGFYNQDFRALERLGQLITQVAGRAGRAEHSGHVLIQTHVPQNPLLNQLIQHGYETFTKLLFTQRQDAGWPPYTHLALIRAHGKNISELLDFLHNIKKMLTHRGLELLGPAPAPMARKASKFHLQLLIKAKTRRTLHGALSDLNILQTNPPKHTIRWSIDVDPIDLS